MIPASHLNGRHALQQRLTLLLGLLPHSRVKLLLLNALGHHFEPNAYCGPVILRRVGRIVLAEGASLGSGNLFKDLVEVRLGPKSNLGRLNMFSAHPVFGSFTGTGGRIALGASSYVTSRHYFDCSGGVTIGDFSAVGGHATSVLTHSIDFARDAQVPGQVVIGSYVFIGTHARLLPGAAVPDHSVVAGGSVVASSLSDRGGLYAGVPARWIRELKGAWFTRSQRDTRRVWLPVTDQTVEDAF